MKYVKGEKLNSIGAIYEHLYSGGVVIDQDSTWRYKIDMRSMLLSKQYGESETEYTGWNNSLDTKCKYYKAVEGVELKEPEFFKVYRHKEDGGRVCIQKINRGGDIIVYYGLYDLQEFWDIFEEVGNENK